MTKGTEFHFLLILSWNHCHEASRIARTTTTRTMFQKTRASGVIAWLSKSQPRSPRSSAR